MASWVTGGLPLLSPLSRLVGVASATSPTHIPPFCPLSIIPEWLAAKMATAVSAHFELHTCSSETYVWRHGHYVHVFTDYAKKPVYGFSCYIQFSNITWKQHKGAVFSLNIYMIAHVIIFILFNSFNYATHCDTFYTTVALKDPLKGDLYKIDVGLICHSIGTWYN